MNNRLLFLVFLAALVAVSLGISNPVGRGNIPAGSTPGGVGSGRVPGSVYRSGLVRSPNPIERSSNLAVTGNVRGGKHFRGIVPYQSRYDFWAELPSSSLDSFFRYSAGSEDIVGGADKYRAQPYYSGTRTVTTSKPGNRGVFQSVNTRIDDRARSKPVLSALPKQNVSVREDEVIAYTRPRSQGLRPLSMSPAELERVILEEIESLDPERKRLADEGSRLRISPLLEDLRKVSDKAPELKLLPGRATSEAEVRRNLLAEDDLLQLPTRTESDEAEREKLDTLGLETELPEPDAQAPEGQVDVYEQMKQQISNIQMELAPGTFLQKQERDMKGGIKAKATDEEELFSVMSEAQRKGRAASEKEEKKAEPILTRRSIFEEFSLTTPQVSEKPLQSERSYSVKDEEVSAKAREILGEHKTFASFAEDKFNRYMRAAESYLNRGRYYRAADAYTLASIYKSDDPLAFAGKSHALFAAGEYMSSALFLSRALEIFPEYAQFNIDLVTMVGDKDKLESRIANVEEWVDESDAAELQFLLAYVYYQIGRKIEAKEMISTAFKKMPQDPSVLALKKAITETRVSR